MAFGSIPAASVFILFRISMKYCGSAPDDCDMRAFTTEEKTSLPPPGEPGPAPPGAGAPTGAGGAPPPAASAGALGAVRPIGGIWRMSDSSAGGSGMGYFVFLFQFASMLG